MCSLAVRVRRLVCQDKRLPDGPAINAVAINASRDPGTPHLTIVKSAPDSCTTKVMTGRCHLVRIHDHDHNDAPRRECPHYRSAHNRGAPSRHHRRRGIRRPELVGNNTTYNWLTPPRPVTRRNRCSPVVEYNPSHAGRPQTTTSLNPILAWSACPGGHFFCSTAQRSAQCRLMGLSIPGGNGRTSIVVPRIQNRPPVTMCRMPACSGGW